jgi:hypothetical protein
MAKYTNEDGSIDLTEYEQVKTLTNGCTNFVFLYKNKQENNLKIVVKFPDYNHRSADLIQHNINAINTFYGNNTAWPLNGKEGKYGFAMKYFEGKTLSDALPQYSTATINSKSPLFAINKNGLLFTMMDPNKNNYLQVPTGEIIPIDFDYMIIHDGKGLLPYQKLWLDHRKEEITYQKQCSEKNSVKNVLNNFPSFGSYLYQHWGNKYLRMDPALYEKNFNSEVDELIKKISDFENKPEYAEAHKAAIILHEELKQESKKYFTGNKSYANYNSFKTNCSLLINTARKDLDKHRGWSKILLNILAIICSAGIGYAIAAGINIAANRGRFTFFSTDSSIKMNVIEDVIDEAAPAF